MRKPPGAGHSHRELFIASENSIPAAVIRILERFGNAADSKMKDCSSGAKASDFWCVIRTQKELWIQIFTDTDVNNWAVKQFTTINYTLHNDLCFHVQNLYGYIHFLTIHVYF